MGAGTRKWLVAYVSSLCMQKNWSGEQFQGLFSRVARFHSRKNRDVDLPNRRRKVAWIAFWFVSLFPAEKARLMLPHIERVGQNGLVLDPDNLLVNQDAAITHRLLDFHLALRGVPHVDRGVGFADGQCLPKERFVARSKRFAFLLIRVPAFPVLVLAIGEILRGMVLCVVGDQIRRVGTKRDSMGYGDNRESGLARREGVCGTARDL